jgi:hypothetical protein
MKIHDTQKLFWKKWPYKAIIEISVHRRPVAYGAGFSYSRKNNAERQEEFARLKSWFKNHLPEAGIRCETHLSVFLATEAELAEVIEVYGAKVIEIWRPTSEYTRELLIEHEYDVVRERLWYGKYPIRARIPYTAEFRNKHQLAFREAVLSLGDETWYAAGHLKDIINSNRADRYGWGQPLHLYFSNPEDAAMLRLYCGDFIERFERIRKP